MEKFEPLPDTKRAFEEFQESADGRMEDQDLVEIDLQDFLPFAILFQEEGKKLSTSERKALSKRYLEAVKGGYFPVHVTYAETDPETGETIRKIAYELPRLFMPFQIPQGEMMTALGTLKNAYHANPRVDLSERSMQEYGQALTQTQVSDRKAFVERIAREQIATRRMMDRKGTPRQEETDVETTEDETPLPGLQGTIRLDDD